MERYSKKKKVYDSQVMQITKSFCIKFFLVCFLFVFFFPLHKKKATCKNLLYASVSVFGKSTLLTDSNHHSDVFSVIIPCLSKQTDVLCTTQSYMPGSVKFPKSF